MSKIFIFSAVVFLILLFPSVFAQESRFTEDYNQQIIKNYIESTPEDSWNIFVFEQKFGPRAAVCYLAGIIMLALIMKHVIK